MRYQARWHSTEKDGYTRAEKFEAGGIDIPDPPELEQGSDHILEWFWQINSRRQSGMSGPAAISFSELKAWQELKRILIRPDEIEAITAMDSAHLEAIHEKQEREKS